LKNYVEFSIITFGNSQAINTLLTKANEDTITYVLDNLKDVNDELGCNKIICYVFLYCCDRINILKKMISIGGKIENTVNWCPIHYLLRGSANMECIKYGLELYIKSGLSIYKKNTDGSNIVSLIFRYTSLEVINYTFNKLFKTTDKEFMEDINVYVDNINQNPYFSDKNNSQIKENVINSFFG
jgi:hypothetical protein